MDFAERTSKNGKILRENIHEPAFNGPPAGHHGVAKKFLFIQVKVMRAMLNKGIHFAERTFIEQ